MSARGGVTTGALSEAHRIIIMNPSPQRELIVAWEHLINVFGFEMENSCIYSTDVTNNTDAMCEMFKHIS